MKKNWTEIRKAIEATDRDVLRKVVAQCDGHSLDHPQLFLDLGLPQLVVDAFTETHESGDGKYQIYVEGQPVPELKAVYGLMLLEYIAGVFGISSWKMGRGSRAADLREQLLQHWEANP